MRKQMSEEVQLDNMDFVPACFLVQSQCNVKLSPCENKEVHVHVSKGSSRRCVMIVQRSCEKMDV